MFRSFSRCYIKTPWDRQGGFIDKRTFLNKLEFIQKINTFLNKLMNK